MEEWKFNAKLTVLELKFNIPTSTAAPTMQPTIMFLFLRSIIIINDNFCIYQRGSSLAAALMVLQYIILNYGLVIAMRSLMPLCLRLSVMVVGIKCRQCTLVSKMTGYLRNNGETVPGHKSPALLCPFLPCKVRPRTT